MPDIWCPQEDSFVPVSISPQQCRAARALIGWNQEDLALRAHVGVSTVRDFERIRDNHVTATETLEKLRAALEAAGVEFISAGKASGRDGGDGVRLSR